MVIVTLLKLLIPIIIGVVIIGAIVAIVCTIKESKKNK